MVGNVHFSTFNLKNTSQEWRSPNISPGAFLVFMSAHAQDLDPTQGHTAYT